MQKKFICGLLAVALAGLTGLAQAQTAPYQATATITNGATSVEWDVPAATYGPLLSLQAYNLTNGATLAVSHIVKASSTVSLTNTVESAAAGATLLVYPSGYVAPQSVCTNTTTGTVITTTPVKPVLLVPGDKLRFTTSIANGSSSIIVIRAGFSGQ